MVINLSILSIWLMIDLSWQEKRLIWRHSLALFWQTTREWTSRRDYIQVQLICKEYLLSDLSIKRTISTKSFQLRTEMEKKLQTCKFHHRPSSQKMVRISTVSIILTELPMECNLLLIWITKPSILQGSWETLTYPRNRVMLKIGEILKLDQRSRIKHMNPPWITLTLASL